MFFQNQSGKKLTMNQLALFHPAGGFSVQYLDDGFFVKRRISAKITCHCRGFLGSGVLRLNPYELGNGC